MLYERCEICFDSSHRKESIRMRMRKKWSGKHLSQAQNVNAIQSFISIDVECKICTISKRVLCGRNEVILKWQNILYSTEMLCIPVWCLCVCERKWKCMLKISKSFDECLFCGSADTYGMSSVRVSVLLLLLLLLYSHYINTLSSKNINHFCNLTTHLSSEHSRNCWARWFSIPAKQSFNICGWHGIRHI